MPNILDIEKVIVDAVLSLPLCRTLILIRREPFNFLYLLLVYLIYSLSLESMSAVTPLFSFSSITHKYLCCLNEGKASIILSDKDFLFSLCCF